MSSFSGLSDFQRCPNLYRYRNVLNLQRKETSRDLYEGTVAHDFLKVFFLGLQAGVSEGEAWGMVLGLFDDYLFEASKVSFTDELVQVEELLDEALYIVQAYINRYSEEWEVLHVEEEFSITLDGYEITFTPDLVVRDKNGYVWIVDHKTTSRLPQAGLPYGDLQHLVYYAGVQGLYPELRGFIFNRLRKKIPSQPRLAKTGKTRVAYLKTIDTTYEVLRDFILEEAPALLGDADHAARLAELRDEPDRFFWTETHYVTAEEIDAVLNDVLWTAQVIEASKEADYWPRFLREDNGWNSCSRCSFSTLCKAEMLDLGVEVALEGYEQRPEKNPYEGEEDG